MNIRRVQVSTLDGHVVLHLETGFATTPMPLVLEADPATALVLASALERAYQRLQVEGEAAPTQKTDPAAVAAAAAHPLADPFQDQPPK